MGGSNGAEQGRVGEVLRDPEPDVGSAHLVASRYADFDILARTHPLVRPGIYRTVSFVLELADSLIFNSVRLCEKIDPEFTAASDWIRREAVTMPIPTCESNGENLQDNSVPAKDVEGPPALVSADKALDGFHSTTQFSPVAFRILGWSLQRLFGGLFLVESAGASCAASRRLQTITDMFYSWICNPRSILYDPALKHKVQRHAQAYLNLFLREISGPQQLRIINADLRRVFVATRWIAGDTAQSQLQDILHRLQQHPLFDGVVVTPADSFVAALQLDERDWVGYRELVPLADGDSQGSIDCMGLLRCLPSPVSAFLRAFIDRAVQLPLLRVLNHYTKDFDDLNPGNDGFSQTNPEPLLQAIPEEVAVHLTEFATKLWFAPPTFECGGLYENANGYNKQLPEVYGTDSRPATDKKRPAKTFFEKLKACIRDPMELIRRYGSAHDARLSRELSFKCLEFPSQLGCRLGISGNWRLEAVKVIARLMELDKNVDYSEQSWVEGLAERRNELFELAGEADFKHANWTSPLKTLWLRDVECVSCSSVKDIDLVANTIEDEVTHEGESVRIKICKCPTCGNALDYDLLEVHLIRGLQEMIYAYMAQDVFCVGCNVVCISHRRDKCKCGSNFKARLDPNTWKEFVQTTQDFAVEMGFETLQACLTQIEGAWK